MAYPPESDQKIYVSNTKGSAELITSLKLYVQRPGASSYEEIGVAFSADINERRNMIYNFCIGNADDPGTARDIIPGLVTGSTIKVRALALYVKNIISLLGDTEGTAWMSSLRYQTRPFIIKEQWTHPNSSGGTGVRTLIYEGCMISDYDKKLDIERGDDIRVVEDVTIHYRKVYVADDTLQTEPSKQNRRR